MTRPSITSAARTPEGARLELDTGEVIQLAPSENTALTSTRPYILMLEKQNRVLNVPAQLLVQVAQALGIASRAPDALPLLIDVHADPQCVHLTTDGPDFAATFAHARPVTFTLRGRQAVNLREPLTLTVYSLPPLAPQLWRYQVEPYTPEGQAALVALGFAGPYPVPEGVSLGGYGHGAALSEAEAFTLAGLPEFVEQWLICPDDAGGLVLLWGDSATTEQLERSITWAELTTASLQAEGRSRGQA